MKRAKLPLLHLGAWCFFIINVLLTYPPAYVQQFGMMGLTVKTVSFYLTMAIGFYANYFVLTPVLLAGKRYVSFAFALLLLIAAMVGLFLLHALFIDWYLGTGSMFLDERRAMIPFMGFEIFFFVLISTGLRFSADWFRMQRLREELHREKVQAELALLRQQLSPHFLFNTLNNIYSLTVHRPEQAPQAMLRLSDLMRSVLRSVERDSVDVENEITQLQSYIELKRLQHSEPYRIDFLVEGDPAGLRIHPMLLLPLAENAFKHGDLHTPGAGVRLHLRIAGGTLTFIVRNAPTTGTRDTTSGIGLANVRRRLDLLYPDRHRLLIEATHELHTVTLSVELT